MEQRSYSADGHNEFPWWQRKTFLKADVGGLVSDLRSEAGRKMRT
jgi:hypothetical protein